jgi:hypothetical protein
MPSALALICSRFRSNLLVSFPMVGASIAQRATESAGGWK